MVNIIIFALSGFATWVLVLIAWAIGFYPQIQGTPFEEQSIYPALNALLWAGLPLSPIVGGVAGWLKDKGSF